MAAQRTFLVALVFFLLPASAFAENIPASFLAGQSLLIASSSPANAYAVGASIVVTAPVAGDFSALGGSIISAAPITGDALLFGGSISSRARVAGDVRVAGGSVDVQEAVAGDLVVLGFSVQDSGRAGGSVFITAANATVANGASGPVTIYANNVLLGGDFGGDVTIVSSGRVRLAPNTVIHGKFSYEAPETARIPASAAVKGAINYTNASYLPDADTSHLLEVVSIGVFLFARVLGALILAGLLAGLFPRLAEAVVERVRAKRLQDILLTMLLGFAILVAAPVFIMLLLLTFVGIGIALLLLILYALIVFLALMYAGILLGGMFSRYVARRETMFWYDGALGMLTLSLMSLVPVAGIAIVALLTVFAAGALLQLFFRFAFPHEEYTPEML